MKTKLARLLSKKRVYAAIFVCIIAITLLYWHELRSNTSSLEALKWTKSSLLFLFFGVMFMVMRDFAYILQGRRI